MNELINMRAIEVDAEKLRISDVVLDKNNEQHVIVSLGRVSNGIEIKFHPSGLNVDSGNNVKVVYFYKKVRIVDPDYRL